MAEFVRKRDPRFKAYLVEEQKRKEAAAAEQKARVQREKQELQAKAADYQTPEWAKVDQQDDFTNEEEEEEEEEVNEFYCVVCDKAYRSEKQFASHESSKRHIENVEILRQEMLQDEENFDFGAVDGQEVAEIVDPGTPLDQLSEHVDDLDVTGEEEEEEMIPMMSSSKKNKKKNKKKAAPKWGYDEEDVPKDLDDVSVLAAALEEERSRRRRKGGQRDPLPPPQSNTTTDTATTEVDSVTAESEPVAQEKESAKTKREKRKEKKKLKEENELTEVGSRIIFCFYDTLIIFDLLHVE